MRIRNMTGRTGRNVANQFIIDGDDGTKAFQSYETVIAVRNRDGSVVLDEAMWDCSATTGKYRNEFLGEGVNETRRKIKDGTYVLADLNT